MSDNVSHATAVELEAGLDLIRAAPKEIGAVRLIVRRPAVGAREVVESGDLSLSDGLVGDTWKGRGSGRTAGGEGHPDMQLNLMSSRAIALVAGDEERWPLAGDQLFIDMDMSRENLPPNTRLELGTAVIVVTAQPHTGCGKFVSRFGLDATTFVNSELGRSLNLRGINARVVTAGTVTVGDSIRRIAAEDPAVRLRRSVERAIPALSEVPDEMTVQRRTPASWSRREVLGHLIDSASNNHQRFVRAQFRDDLVFPGYDQDAWVVAQRYHETPWPDLVSLWHQFNLHLCRVIDAIPDVDRQRWRHPHNLHEIASRGVPKGESVTLDYFLHDYVDHLGHHLLQILGPDVSPEWRPLGDPN